MLPKLFRRHWTVNKILGLLNLDNADTHHSFRPGDVEGAAPAPAGDEPEAGGEEEGWELQSMAVNQPAANGPTTT